MDKPRARPPGLRTAVVVYILIVVGLLGGGAAFALWSQSGTAAVNVKAAPIPPKSVPKSIDCDRTDSGNKSNIRIVWTASDASGYRIRILDNRDVVVSTAVAGTVHTASLTRPSLFSTDSYTLHITPFVGDVTADPATWVLADAATSWTMTLRYSLFGTVTCT